MSQNNTNNPSYVVVNGVTYFKLKSDYPGDYTKNCGLLGEEIDKNFFFLRSYDIQSVNVDETGFLTLTRVDGDQLKSELPVSNYKFDYNPKNGKLTITRPDGTQDVLEGFLVEQYVSISTDETLYGKGTAFNPFGISPVEKTGTFAPAEKFMDLTGSQKLPTNLPKGSRILTKENLNVFGCLYDYYGIELINEKLNEKGSAWRIPTREDWADMLDAAEYCAEDRNHNVTCVNEWTGRHAGARAKSTNIWNDSTRVEEGFPVKGEDNLPSTGTNTFKVLPVGYGEGSRGSEDPDYDLEAFKKLACFWSNSEVGCCNSNSIPNFYTRTFSYDTRKVLQESTKPSSRLSLRLVRDYNGSETDMREFENILGYNIPCVLITNEETEYSKIWTSINVGFLDPLFSGVTSTEWDEIEGGGKREVFFINEWNGNEWIKKQMKIGDSVVLIDGGKDSSGKTIYNHEWRVYSGATCNKVVLRDTVEALQMEYAEEIRRIDERIDQEISARTEGDIILQGQIDEEVNERIAEISGLTIEKVDTNEDDVREAYKLIDKDGNQHGELIKIYKDEKIHKIQVGHIGGVVNPETGDITDGPLTNDDALQIVYRTNKGIYELIEINLDEIFKFNAGDGIVFENGKINVKIDEISDRYLTVGPSGVCLTGVEEDIINEISARTLVDVILQEQIDELSSASTAEYLELKKAIEDEISARTISDINLQNQVNEEVSARTLVDAILQEQIDVLSGLTEEEILARINGDTNIANILGISGNTEDGFVVEFARPKYVPTEHTSGHTFQNFDHFPEYTEIVEGGYWNFEESKAVLNEYIELEGKYPVEYYQLVAGTKYIQSAKSFMDAVKALDESLKNEENRAIVSENNLNDAITAETTRATETEITLENALADEIANRIADVNDEQERAEEKEAELNEAIVSEVARANESEANLNNAILEEKSRAEAKEKSITVSSADKTISTIESDNGTNIEVNIDNSTLVKDFITGTLSAALNITSISPSSTNVKEEYVLVDKNNNVLGDHIKIYKDSSLYRVYIGHIDDEINVNTGEQSYVGTGDTALCLIYHKEDGKYELAKINIERFIVEAEFKDGLVVNNHEVRVLIDNTSEPFLTVGLGGVRLSGVQSAISGETQRAIMAENDIRTALSAETQARENAISLEKSDRKAADDALQAQITTNKEDIELLNTNLYADNSNPQSIKHVILTDTVIASEVTSEPALSQSLLRKVNGKFYASNNSSDMLYKGASLETTIDLLSAASGSAQTDIAALKLAMASATTRIETLEHDLVVVSGALVTLMNTMEQTIKDTVASILKGTDEEIKVDTSDSSNIKIGFADNAVFGPISL